MLCVKQEGRLEHHSSPSGFANYKLELFFCNESDSPGESQKKVLSLELEVNAGRVEG